MIRNTLIANIIKMFHEMLSSLMQFDFFFRKRTQRKRNFDKYLLLNCHYLKCSTVFIIFFKFNHKNNLFLFHFS